MGGPMDMARAAGGVGAGAGGEEEDGGAVEGCAGCFAMRGAVGARKGTGPRGAATLFSQRHAAVASPTATPTTRTGHTPARAAEARGDGVRAESPFPTATTPPTRTEAAGGGARAEEERGRLATPAMTRQSTPLSWTQRAQQLLTSASKKGREPDPAAAASLQVLVTDASRHCRMCVCLSRATRCRASQGLGSLLSPKPPRPSSSSRTRTSIWGT